MHRVIAFLAIALFISSAANADVSNEKTNFAPSQDGDIYKDVIFLPVDGAHKASDFHLAALNLEYTEGLRFQVSENRSFTATVIDITTKDYFLLIDDLPAGQYFWRVCPTDEGGSAWSSAREFSIAPYDLDEVIGKIESDRKGGGDSPPDFPLAPSESLGDWHIIGCPHIQQTKDTHMVCLDGCPMTGDHCWEDPHPVTSSFSGGHRDAYCARACIAMIAALGGCTLSQDRISYYIFEEAGSASESARNSGHIGDPFMDLGHDEAFLDTDILLALDWLYRAPPGSSTSVPYTAGLFDDGDRSDMDTIREFIDEGRPVIRDVFGTMTAIHSTIIDGYLIVVDGTGAETPYVHMLDSAVPDEESWETLIVGQTLHIEFPPTTGSPSRCDEPGVSADSDNDGLVDFDELNRFETDPYEPDTDQDGLNDMTDMLGWLFDPDGSYNLRDRDFDGDGLPKVLDLDNDRPSDDGVSDGCEDFNLDGFFTPDGQETDQFNPDDDGDVENPYCVAGFIRIHSDVSLAAFPGFELRVDEEVEIEAGAQILSDDYIHEFFWKLESTPLVVEAAGQNIVTVADGSGEGLVSLRMRIGENGRYTLIADCNPRVGSYTITTTGAGTNRISEHDIHLALGAHHYSYVSPEAPPMVFEMLDEVGHPNEFIGRVERDEEGVRYIAGEDTFELPAEFTGMSGTCTREWEIRLDRLPPR